MNMAKTLDGVYIKNKSSEQNRRSDQHYLNHLMTLIRMFLSSIMFVLFFGVVSNI